MIDARDPALLRWVGLLVTATAVLSFTGLLMTTLLGVAARYFALRGVEWTFEAAAIFFLWTTFFGVLVAELRRENVAFTLFVDRLGASPARLVAVAAGVVTLCLALFLVRSGLAFAERSGAAPTPVLRLPRLVTIAPMVTFSCGLFLIVAVRLVVLLRGGSLPAAGHPPAGP